MSNTPCCSWFTVGLALLWLGYPSDVAADDAPPQKAEMAGYLLVPHGKVDEKYNAGFSMYVAAWPLLKNYPGQEFQSGLFGTWMFAQYDGPKPEKTLLRHRGRARLVAGHPVRHRDAEVHHGRGGPELREWANGPGAGKGRDWKKPAGHYAIAQLSPWVLWPPDGLNLKQGTCGELFGYGYLPLPLTAPKKTTAGQGRADRQPLLDPVPEHRQLQGAGRRSSCRTSGRGRPSRTRSWAGCSSTPGRPSRTRRCRWRPSTSRRTSAEDAKGDTYARVAPTRFPAKADGDAPLIHRITAYNKAALWDGVEAWFDGGKAASGAIDPKAAAVHTFEGKGGAPGRSTRPNTPRGQEGAARLELVRHPRRPRRHHLRLPVGQGRGDDAAEGRGARHPARVLPPGEGQEGQGAVGGGQRQGRAGRDRSGEGGVPARRKVAPNPYASLGGSVAAFGGGGGGVGVGVAAAAAATPPSTLVKQLKKKMMAHTL